MITIERDGVSLTYDEDTHRPVATYKDGVCTELVAELIQQPVVEVPQEISRRQGDLMLYDEGLYDTVQAVIATLHPRQQIEANAASVYARDNALLNSVLTAAGKTSEEIDQLFIGALSK